MGKELALKEQRSEFTPQYPYKKQGVAAHTCDSDSGCWKQEDLQMQKDLLKSSKWVIFSSGIICI